MTSNLKTTYASFRAAIQPVKNDSPVFVSLLSGRQRIKYGVGVAFWVVAFIFFWQWWLQPSHNLGWVRYLTITSGMVWLFFLQIYLLAVFSNSKRAVAAPPSPGSCRVAMIVTKTPSEPFAIVRRTLEAMLNQDYPNDTWLADEDPTADTIAWCERYGVRISTRKGVAEYHQKKWPRRTRCKEGNLAYFYDNYGYENYDFVAQLDADHVPSPSYLREMLRPYADPRIGYVSAPSICSNNAAESWSARARLFSEAVFHGGLQAGYTDRWAPMCIGSHYSVRTKALKEIGGLGPELAEDHSTSLLMNAGGWRGAHAIDAIAFGDGPASFSDMITQEFQWSRSLMTIFLQYTPRYFRALPFRMKFQFLFCQLWYPLFAIFMALMFLIPVIALTLGVQFADVTYPAFIAHAAPAPLVLTVLAFQMRRDGLLRPNDSKVMGWEIMLFPCAKWPWVMWGCIMAIWDHVRGDFVDFRITPKGTQEKNLLPARVLAPYFVLTVILVLPVIFFGDVREARGFYFLALFNALFYTALFAIIVFKHKVENGIVWKVNTVRQGTQFSAAVCLFALVFSATSLRGLDGLEGLSKGLEPLKLTETKYLVSGAGIGAAGTTRTKLRIRWE